MEHTQLVLDGDYNFLIRESTKGRMVVNVKVQITQKKAAVKVSILFLPTDSGTYCTRLLSKESRQKRNENETKVDGEESGHDGGNNEPQTKKKKTVSIMHIFRDSANDVK